MFRFIYFMLCMALVLNVIGCAPTTSTKLKEDQINKITFRIDKNYQEVYRRISRPARENFQASFLGGARAGVQCDLFTDIKKGEVEVYLDNIFPPRQVYLTSEIVADGDESTVVTTYYALQIWRRNAERIEEWARTEPQP